MSGSFWIRISGYLGYGITPRRLSENSILGDLAIVNSTTYEVKKAE
jgi:hypothetical protein